MEGILTANQFSLAAETVEINLLESGEGAGQKTVYLGYVVESPFLTTTGRVTGDGKRT